MPTREPRLVVRVEFMQQGRSFGGFADELTPAPRAVLELQGGVVLVGAGEEQFGDRRVDDLGHLGQ